MIAISVIIPFHNRPEYFDRLFNSLYKIKRDDVEIVFVDNNSDAKTREIIQSYISILREQTSLKISIITELRPGAPAARNAGLEHAIGDYVYFFDSDDELSADMLTMAYYKAKQDDADVVALRTKILINGRKMVFKKMVFNENPRYQIICNNIATQTVFLKRSFALNHARWNEQLFYWNDLEWGLRILLSWPKISWLHGCFHTIYVHTNSITGASFAQRLNNIIYAHQAMQDDILKYSKGAKQRHELLTMLDYRTAIYAGHIFKEGYAKAAEQLLSIIDKSDLSHVNKIKVKILFFLSKIGLPGLWRLI